MKAPFHFVILLLLGVIIAWPLAAFCQGGAPLPPRMLNGKSSVGGAMGGGAVKMTQTQGYAYSPSTVISVSGTVEHVTPNGFAGTHLDLKSGSHTFDVYVGPTSFLQSKGFILEQGDRIRVTGSRITGPNLDEIIAREVKKGDQVLILRNTKGTPQWSGAAR